MPKPGTLKFIPRADEWNVNFIRYKRRETFFLDEKYMVTVTTVKEHCVDWREMRSGESVDVAPENYEKPHMEVEVRCSSYMLRWLLLVVDIITGKKCSNSRSGE